MVNTTQSNPNKLNRIKDHEMLDISTTENWHARFSGSHIGVLLMRDIDNSKRKTQLEDKKKSIESNLRSRFNGWSRKDLLKNDTLQAYKNYYKKFNKNLSRRYQC